MYDDHHRFDLGPWGHRPGLHRLTHLVLVDGRLVDTWSEPVHGTEWQHHADRFDRDRLPPVPPPAPPPHQQVLAWLDEVCGGRAAVEALDAAPLVEDGLDLPEVHLRQDRERLEAVAELLDAVAVRWFDTETSFAFRRALLLVWAEDPRTVTEMRSAALTAAGTCWAVAKANGRLRPVGDLTVGRIQEAFAVSSSPSAPGQKIRAALHGFRGWPLAASGSSGHLRPAGVPDLLPLGHADLLVASTRQTLVRLRERALAARDHDVSRAG